MPFSIVSRTSVEASFMYVLVEAPLRPEASERLDLLEFSSIDRIPGAFRRRPAVKVVNAIHKKPQAQK